MSVNIKFQKYPAYKDSGVEWLGEIPEGWDANKLKYLCGIYNGDSLNESQKKKYSSENTSYRPYISSKDINVNDASVNYVNGLKIPIDNQSFKIAEKDSVLLCIEGGSAGKKIAFTNQSVCFVNKLACFKGFSNNIDKKYLFYSLKSSPFITQFNFSMSGLIGGVAISLLKNLSISTPPLLEQTAIAHFLDDKTAKIDSVIAQKEKMIALLKERKQIIIQNAVTKGLDPNAKMKDSGVEWIGEIPVGWEVVKNKILFVERKEPGEEGLPLLSVSIHSAVSSEELSDEQNIRGLTKIEDKRSYKYVDVDDIVYNMMRAWQGAIGAVRVKGMVSPAYVVAKPNNKILSSFFEYQYRTSAFIQQMNCFSKGITDFRKRLYWDEFKQLICILPLKDEQAKIVTYIKTQSTKIDQSIALQQKQIDKLKEYKAVLIDSAVTGKVKIV